MNSKTPSLCVTPSGPRRRLARVRSALLALVCVLAAASLSATATGAWTTNLAQLDDGTCGRNLQLGSDKSASASNTPTFWLMGDGGLSSYQMFIDGVSIGTFNSAGNGNVCVTTSAPLSDGAHTLTGNELAPRSTNTVTPFAFTVDTVPPSVPSAPLLSGYSDSGVIGDGITSFRNVNFTGTSEALVSVQLSANAAGLGGAVADVSGHWSATTTSLSDGTYTVRAVTLDSAGNRSAMSPGTQITIETLPPATHDAGFDTPPLGNNTTTVSSPVVTATATSDVRTLTATTAAPVVVVDPAKALRPTGATKPASAPLLYKNCTNLNKRYPHGVGKPRTRDKTSGEPVTNFRRSTKLYRIAMSWNRGLDRDKDGIACEKH